MYAVTSALGVITLLVRWDGTVPGGCSFSRSLCLAWGVNSLGQIYRYTGYDASPWIGIPGSAVDNGVAADGTVWHVNSVGAVYRYTGV
ncbi:hypothetical protein GCM10022420_044380 [Streptomyces iranensis]|uniref:Uncharacterized protein n=1 Tax=Streptomyces iranensis TaxID=576784 RepID=A0ABS4N4Z5_9ACTN|nr:hypothetical protein [Streptomyces iranensis]